MLKLIIEDDEGKTTVVPLIRDEITIGRKEGNTIRLTERNVSRKHARLVKQNGAVFVEDVGSYNGVKLNGVKIGARSPIGEGDQVLIGDYKLAIRMDRPAVAPGPAAAPTSSPAMRTTMLGVNTASALANAGVTAPASDDPNRTAPATPHAMQPFGPASTPGAPAVTETPATVSSSPTMHGFAPPPQIAAHAAAVSAAMTPAAPQPDAVSVPGSPDGEMEGSPTIPVRTLADQGLVPGAAPPARLVVVSTELAGAEFLLDRASVVIGRTEENDVVLNHRSISRHHAKLVRDGERYTIVDLQSANGVRVNGFEYERTEVKPGDSVELGHVKLRFVGSGEAFTFDPSAVESAPRSSMKLFAGLAVGVVAVAAGVYIFMSGPEKPTSKLIEVSPTVATNPTTPTPAATQAPAPTEPPGETAQALVAKATAAMTAENWDDAKTSLVAALAKEPGDAHAKELLQKVDVALNSAKLFASMKTEADGKNLDGAMAAWLQIPEDSSYKDKARPLFTSIRPRFVQTHLEQAEKLRAQGQCKDVKDQADAVLAVDEKNPLAREVVRMCRPKAGAVAVAQPKPAPAPKPAPVPKAAAPKPAPKPAAPKPEPRVAKAEPPAPRPVAAPHEDTGADPQALLKQARDAYFRGQHAAAIDAAKKAIRAKPGFMEAYQIMAAAYCSLRDADGVSKVYGRLDDKNKQLVRSMCQRNGIQLN